MNFNLSFGFGNKPKSVHINERGDIQYHMMEVSLNNKVKGFKNKYNLLINSPAFMSPARKVFDLASQARINSYKEDGKINKVNAIYDVATKPNKFQSWTEFHATVVFRALCGSAWIYAPNDRVSESDSIFVLDPNRIEIEPKLIERLSKFILSEKTYKEIFKEQIRYVFPDGSSEDIELSKIRIVSAMPNGLTNNFLESLSLIDCLIKPILNSESALDSENANLFLARKLMVTKKGANTLGEFNTQGDKEKQSTEESLTSEKLVTSSNVELHSQRLIEGKDALKIPESYINSSLIIADVLGVDKALLPFSNATYENQEKGAGRTIEYAVMPIMDKYIEVLEYLTNIPSLKASFDHCSFNQVFGKEREEKNKLTLENIQKAIELNLLSLEEAKRITNEVFGL